MRLSPLVTVALLAATAAPAAAQTVQTIAYWRFEDPEAANGQPVPGPPPGTGGVPYAPYIRDSSGNNNELRTFSTDTPDTRPRWSNFVSTQTLGSGLTNNFALDFTPNQDIYSGTGNGSPSINTFNFSGNWTIEASFLPRNLSRYHGIVGQDGSPGGGIAYVQMKLRDDSDQFQIELRDTTGANVQVQSSFVPTVGQWYHLAAVSEGNTLSLYVRGPNDSDYVLQGTTATAGGIFNNGQNENWTVGRGFFDNNITDWADGLIDEVRVSNGARSPSQFLFANPVPEPSSLALGGLAALAGWRLRRRGK